MTPLEKIISPTFSLNTAENFVFKHFGIIAKASNLVGYSDQNFYILAENKTEYVLKIMSTNASKRVLQVHNEVMTFLQHQVDGLSIPKVIPNLQGSKMIEVSDEQGNRFNLRLLSWVKGQLWENILPSLDLYEELGQKLGKMTQALQKFAPPCLFPSPKGFHWETSSANWIEQALVHIKAEKDKKTIRYFLPSFTSQVQQNLSALRDGFIHNDANTFNIVVKEENKKQEVIGIIDFGLAMPSKIVCELAIACAYLAMKRPNPLEIIGAITKGFNTVFPLNVAEMNAIFPLMAQRIIISITHSALNHKKGITNEYVYASEKNGWDLLRQLEEAIPQVAVMRSGA
ncbi:MAG: hypothetical protein RLZZ292_2568 [Bacteroidota bacterium]|jgi:Ser/Thr protein kinase RdoA (MazF antagonist)